MSIDVSITMPLYKNASSIRRCLDSILAQDFKGNYEVIMACDDSGDGTLAICEKYEDKYPDKFILHHPNYRMGVSGARKEALNLARGKYIYAADGDDELKENCLSTLVSTLEKYDADLVNCSFYLAKNSRKGALLYPFRLPTRVYDTAKAVSAFLMDASFRGFLWTKLYKTELLKKSPQISMPGQNVIFEDVAFVSSLLSHCKKVVNIPTPLYYYYKDNPNSEVTRPRKDRAIRHLAVFAVIRLFFQAQNQPKVIKAFRRKGYRMKWSLLFDLGKDKKGGLTKQERKAILKEFKKVVAKDDLDYKGSIYEQYVDGAIIYS